MSKQGLQIKELLEELIDAPLDLPPDADLEFEFGFKVPERERAGLTYGKLLVRRLLTMACAGNEKAIQEVLDRVVGKPVQVQHNLNVAATYEDLLRSLQASALASPTIIDLPAPDPRRQLAQDLGL